MYFQVLKILKSFQLYIQVDKIQAFLNVHIKLLTERPTDWLASLSTNWPNDWPANQYICQFINWHI